MQNKITYNGSHEASSFITYKDEKLFFATRRHISVVFLRLGITALCAFASVVFFILLEKLALKIWFPLIFSEAIFLLFLTSVSVKIVVDWFFHMYVVTSRKVLDISYKPFFAEDINVVPLDQVRCVEIQVVSRGFLNMLLDVGNILLEFDLFTHKDTFHMANISASQETGIMLAEKLNQIISEHVETLGALPPVQEKPKNQSKVTFNGSQNIYTQLFQNKIFHRREANI